MRALEQAVVERRGKRGGEGGKGRGDEQEEDGIPSSQIDFVSVSAMVP